VTGAAAAAGPKLSPRDTDDRRGDTTTTTTVVVVSSSSPDNETKEESTDDDDDEASSSQKSSDDGGSRHRRRRQYTLERKDLFVNMDWVTAAGLELDTSVFLGDVDVPTVSLPGVSPHQLVIRA